MFHVSDLEDLMKAGRLVEARNYVWRFAPPGGGGGEPSSSAEAVTLWKFIHQLMVLDSFAHGGIRDHTAIRGWFTRILAEPPGFSVLYPSCLALAAHFVAGRVEAARDMADWKVVRSKAASLAGKMAREAPEIRCTMLLPLARAKPKDLFPLIASSSFRRRRYVKAARRASSSHLAQFYLNKKKRLPSPSHPGQSYVSRSELFALLEVCLYTGRRPRPCTEDLSKQGIHSVPFMRTMLTNSSNKGNPANIHPLHHQGQNSTSDEGEGLKKK